jgi:tetratricopeptide (TPR) repeat protein
MSVRTLVAATALAFVAPVVAFAQSGAEHLRLGDDEYARFRTASALTHYEAAATADPKNYEALYKAARTAMDQSEMTTDKEQRSQLFKKGELYARRAIEANPRDAEGYFHLARSLGRLAQSLGVRDRIKYATAVRENALEALKYDPKHAGALHVMGVWNQEVMRLNGISRMIAKNLLGGKVFSEASWGNAVKYMEQSVAADPDRITHKLDLGKVYADVGQKDKARAMFEAVIAGKQMDAADPQYKKEAEEALRELK